MTKNAAGYVGPALIWLCVDTRQLESSVALCSGVDSPETSNDHSIPLQIARVCALPAVFLPGGPLGFVLYRERETNYQKQTARNGIDRTLGRPPLRSCRRASCGMGAASTARETTCTSARRPKGLVLKGDTHYLYVYLYVYLLVTTIVH